MSAFCWLQHSEEFGLCTFIMIWNGGDQASACQAGKSSHSNSNGRLAAFHTYVKVFYIPPLHSYIMQQGKSYTYVVNCEPPACPRAHKTPLGRREAYMVCTRFIACKYILHCIALHCIGTPNEQRKRGLLSPTLFQVPQHGQYKRWPPTSVQTTILPASIIPIKDVTNSRSLQGYLPTPINLWLRRLLLFTHTIAMPRRMQPALTITTMPIPSSKRDHSQSQTSLSSITPSPSLPLPKFLTHPLPALHQKFKSITAHEAFLRRSAAPPAAVGSDDESDDAMQAPTGAHPRNRYADIFPWPHNAVQLRSLEDPYLNASPVALGRRGERFIATQGPLAEDGGESHFWEMVWQERCEVIVMLTQAWEDGREKCCVYYPTELHEIKEIEGWGIVECVGVREQERTQIRELRIWKGADENEEGEEPKEKREEDATNETERVGEARTVWHFLFLGWPDHDIPVSPRDQSALLELIKLSRFRMQSEKEKHGRDEAETDEKTVPPRIVHCSAGVGRTGTFIALDHLLHELKDGKFDCLADVDQKNEENDKDADNDNDGMEYSKDRDDDPVFETVKRLREQRMLLVGKPRQYAFIYQMLRERWVARETGNQPSAVEEGLSNGDESKIKKRKVAPKGSGYENDLDGGESSDME